MKKKKDNLKTLKITLGITAVLVGGVIGQGLVRHAHEPSAQKPSAVKQQPTVDEFKGPLVTDEMFQYLTLVNTERINKGLGELTIDPRLNQSASDKCQDMQTRGYTAHTDPDGHNYTQFIGKYYKYLGEVNENLVSFANSTFTPEEGVKAWMESTAHREAILEPAFKKVGYAICHGSQGQVVVQHMLVTGTNE